MTIALIRQLQSTKYFRPFPILQPDEAFHISKCLFSQTPSVFGAKKIGQASLHLFCFSCSTKPEFNWNLYSSSHLYFLSEVLVFIYIPFFHCPVSVLNAIQWKMFIWRTFVPGHLPPYKCVRHISVRN